MLSGIGAADAAAASSLFVCAFIYEEERDGGAPSESPCSGLIRCKCMYGATGAWVRPSVRASSHSGGRPPNGSGKPKTLQLQRRRGRQRKGVLRFTRQIAAKARRRRGGLGSLAGSDGVLARSLASSLPPSLPPHRLDFPPSPPFTPLDRKRPRLRPPQASKARPLAGNPERERPMGRDLENADGPKEEGRERGRGEGRREGRGDDTKME